MKCPRCGQSLDPADHGGLICDGEVFCDRCHRYDRRLLESLPWEDIIRWNRRICQAFGYPPPTLTTKKSRPLVEGPFDFLEPRKLLMAEAYHQDGTIVLFSSGLRLATLCHELAHLMTAQDHTEAWARTCARLVAWVKEELPPDRYTAGFSVNLLDSSGD